MIDSKISHTDENISSCCHIDNDIMNSNEKAISTIWSNNNNNDSHEEKNIINDKSKIRMKLKKIKQSKLAQLKVKRKRKRKLRQYEISFNTKTNLILDPVLNESNKTKHLDWNLVDFSIELEYDKTLSSLYSINYNYNIIHDSLFYFFPNGNNSNNSNMTKEDDYTLCTMNNEEKAYFVLFKQIQSPITEPNINTEPTSFNERDNEDILSKENINTNTNNNIISHSDLNLAYSNSFTLNSLSHKILSSETRINNSFTLNDDNSYITNQLLIKRKMLNEVMQDNMNLSKLIGSNYQKEEMGQTPIQKTIANYIREQKKNKNILNYKTIYKRLNEGLRDKTYSSLISDISPIRFNHDDIIENEIKSYYKTKSECCICLTNCPYSSSHIVYCYKCNVGIHTNCYGLSFNPIWFKCDLCTFLYGKSTKKIRNDNIKCIFCRKSSGALKKIVNNTTWAHMTCVLISSYVYFADYSELDHIKWLDSFNETILLTDTHKCAICNDYNGEKFRCVACRRLYHFFCAYFKGFKMELEYSSTYSPSKKSVRVRIKQCQYDVLYNKLERSEQSSIRQLIYHKKRSMY